MALDYHLNVFFTFCISSLCCSPAVMDKRRVGGWSGMGGRIGMEWSPHISETPVSEKTCIVNLRGTDGWHRTYSDGSSEFVPHVDTPSRTQESPRSIHTSEECIKSKPPKTHKHIDGKLKCSATTSKGLPCKNNSVTSVDGRSFCHTHAT